MDDSNNGLLNRKVDQTLAGWMDESVNDLLDGLINQWMADWIYG